MKKVLIFISLSLLIGCSTIPQQQERVTLSYNNGETLVYKADNNFVILNAFMRESAQQNVNMRLEPINEDGEYRMFRDMTDEKECNDAELQKIHFYKGRYVPKNTGYPVLYGGQGELNTGPLMTVHRDFTFFYKESPEAKPVKIKAYSTNVKDQWYRLGEYDTNSASAHAVAIPTVILRETVGIVVRSIMILSGG